MLFGFCSFGNDYRNSCLDLMSIRASYLMIVGRSTGKTEILSTISSETVNLFRLLDHIRRRRFSGDSNRFCGGVLMTHSANYPNFNSNFHPIIISIMIAQSRNKLHLACTPLSPEAISRQWSTWNPVDLDINSLTEPSQGVVTFPFSLKYVLFRDSGTRLIEWVPPNGSLGGRHFPNCWSGRLVYAENQLRPHQEVQSHSLRLGGEDRTPVWHHRRDEPSGSFSRIFIPNTQWS